MTRDPLNERIRELSWRQQRSPEQEAELKAWLSAHPDSRESLNEETELSRVLGELPAAPVPSNFTARVLQEAMRPTLKPQSRWAWLARARWLPRAAMASVLLGVAVLSYHHVQETRTRRAEIARSVALVSDSRALPNPEVLENFDAIAAMSPSGADEQLLVLFK